MVVFQTNQNQMKITTVLFICSFICLTVTKDFYVSEKSGSDGNTGSKTDPFLTLNKAHETLSDGDVVFLEFGI